MVENVDHGTQHHHKIEEKNGTLIQTTIIAETHRYMVILLFGVGFKVEVGIIVNHLNHYHHKVREKIHKTSMINGMQNMSSLNQSLITPLTANNTIWKCKLFSILKTIQMNCTEKMHGKKDTNACFKMMIHLTDSSKKLFSDNQTLICALKLVTTMRNASTLSQVLTTTDMIADFTQNKFQKMHVQTTNTLKIGCSEPTMIQQKIQVLGKHRSMFSFQLMSTPDQVKEEQAKKLLESLTLSLNNSIGLTSTPKAKTLIKSSGVL